VVKFVPRETVEHRRNCAQQLGNPRYDACTCGQREAQLFINLSASVKVTSLTAWRSLLWVRLAPLDDLIGAVCVKLRE